MRQNYAEGEVVSLLKQVLQNQSEMKTELGGMKTELGGVKSQLNSLDSRMDSVETGLGDVMTNVATVVTDVNDLKTRPATMEGGVPTPQDFLVGSQRSEGQGSGGKIKTEDEITSELNEKELPALGESADLARQVRP